MIEVRNQAEFDAAYAADPLQLIVVRGSARVVARDSARVVAWGSARVVARDSAHVDAWDSVHVVARDSVHVVARDSVHVKAWGSAHVKARGSAHVEAWDSAHVKARDSAHVEAWDSAHVEARDSAHVEARGSAHVTAGSHVSVARKSSRASITGGVVIDHTAMTGTPEAWLAYRGVRVVDGKALLFKAVDPDLRAGVAYGAPTRYEVGSVVEARDFNPVRQCGYGLHFSASPLEAKLFRPESEATRFLRVEVEVSTLITLGDKVKAPRCRVLAEVDEWGAGV